MLAGMGCAKVRELADRRHKIRLFIGL